MWGVIVQEMIFKRRDFDFQRGEKSYWVPGGES